MIRVGIGSDIHKFTTSQRKLVIGGVEVPYYKGLIGNSDGDVLIHAVCDSILGAIRAGDIGVHFPPDDQRFTDISSMVLLAEVGKMCYQRGYRIVNIDSMVICEKPKLQSFIPRMIDNIAEMLKISADSVSIKATTSEGLGFTGRGEGILANAVTLVEKT
ncbi:MAG TPA: 2-C-methyl-D-erythritol 2,4-cyclodiphosphate synthase [bacterium]